MHEPGASDRPGVHRADFGRKSLPGVHVDGQPIVTALGFGVSTATATPTAVSDDREGGEVQTRATYRFLLMRGLNPTEAANLTAYLCGIDVEGSHWSIGEVNRLLFLRRLARSGRWSGSEDAASRQDRPAQAA